MEPRDLPPIETPDVWQRIQNDPRPIVVYGMGNGADKLFDRLARIQKTPAAVMASDDFVRGQSFRSYPVLRFSEVRGRYSDFLLLVSFATRQTDVMECLFSMADAYPLYLPDMPVVGETDFSAAFYREHREEFGRVYDLLEDNLSKHIFASALWYKLTGDIRYLRDAFSTKEQEEACFRDRRILTAVDGGAYNGDTVRSLLLAHPEATCIYAVEPDRRTFRKLGTYITAAGLEGRVHPIRAALWQEEGSAHFSAAGNRNSSLLSASYEFRDEEVPLLTVDALLAGRTVDYVKYDVEGAERQALLGSRESILRSHPVLALSLYHRSEDLFALPLLLHEMEGGYRFYLRRPPCLPAWEMTLYAV